MIEKIGRVVILVYSSLLLLYKMPVCGRDKKQSSAAPDRAHRPSAWSPHLERHSVTDRHLGFLIRPMVARKVCCECHRVRCVRDDLS